MDGAGLKPTFWRSYKKIIISLLILGVLAAGSAVFYFRLKSFSESRLEFKIEAPSEISAGEIASYKLSFVNANKVELRNLKLTFFYPADSVPVKDGQISEGITNQTFDLENLAPRGKNETVIEAFLVGDKGNIKIARALLTYTPTNLKTTFKKEVSAATTITSLEVPLSLVAPPTTISGQKIEYLLDYRNQTDKELTELRLKAKYPDSFAFSSALPLPTAGQNIWEIKNLKPGAGARIIVSGTLSGTSGESKAVSFTLQKKIEGSENSYIDFEKVETASLVSDSPLLLTLKLNNSRDYTAHLNDRLNYSLEFKNNTNFSLSGLNIRAKLEGTMFDLASIESDGFFDGRENTIGWDSSIIPQLGNLGPNQTGRVNFIVRVKPSFGSGSIGASNTFIKVSADIQTPNVPSSINLGELVSSDQLVTRITAAPVFDQKVLINDPILGSSGPFPPRVDVKTIFAIHWSLVNPSNDLSPAKVTAVLAPGAKWENRILTDGTQAQPSYSARDNTVTWDLGRLPGGVGLTLPKYETAFQISITPSVNQVGSPADLLKNIKFDSVDVSTREIISLTVRDARSSNVSDSNRSGQVEQ